MNLERFERERGQAWEELERLLRQAGRRPERLGPERVLRLGALYRAAAADLALARRAFPGDPLVARLERLVGRARHLVYDAPTRRGSLVRFFRRDYWRLVGERPVPLLAAVVLLVAPGVLGGAWALEDPGAAIGLVPAQYHVVVEPGREGRTLAVEEQAAFSSAVFTNNIQVALLAFAGGIAAGLLTVAVVLYNGLLFGTLAGLAIGAGNGRYFFEVVTAHGVLELSCIVVAVATGLRLGWAIVEPGYRTRVESLVAEGGRAVQIVLGTAPWLVLAGLVEGFLTPRLLGLAVVAPAGLALGLLYWLLLWRLGRATPHGATSRVTSGV